MSAPSITSGSFNEGIGHGGFYAQVFNGVTAIGTGQYYVFNPMEVNPETKKITFTDPLGGVTAKAGVNVDKDCSFTVQVPCTVSGGTATPVALLTAGYTFTDPNGRTWWIMKAGESYRDGEVWKQNCEATIKLSA